MCPFAHLSVDPSHCNVFSCRNTIFCLYPQQIKLRDFMKGGWYHQQKENIDRLKLGLHSETLRSGEIHNF